MKKVIFVLCAAGVACAVQAQQAEQLRGVEVVGVKRQAGEVTRVATVVDSAMIANQRINSVRDLGEVAPNFYMPQYGSRMTSAIYVRGLGARIDQPVVGLTVDNVPYLNKDNYDFDLFDIDRVEVLRGSRAILNGRNAMGGQINITTLSPWSLQGVRLLGEYGRHNAYKGGIWAGKRLSSNLAGSLSASATGTDGAWTNEYTGHKVGRERNESARLKLSWHPHSRWSLSNTASFAHNRQHGYAYASVASGQVAYNDDMGYRRSAFADGLSVSYSGNRMIATSLTSVQYLNDRVDLDQDFLPVDNFTMYQARREWVITQDLFAKGRRGKYGWLTGVFAFGRNTHMDAPVTFHDSGIATLIEDNVNKVIPAGMHLQWDERTLTLGSRFHTKNGAFAIYHESSVQFGAFALKAGLRWDIEHIGLYYTSACNTSCTMYRQLPTGAMIPLMQRPIVIGNNGYLGQTFNELLPQLEATWTYGPGGLRLGVSKGYKAGGYNTQMFSDILQQQLMEQVGLKPTYDINKMLTYKPEKAWTFELSASHQAPSGRWSTEIVAFAMLCRDQQLTVFPDGLTTGRQMTNAGRTRSLGVEASAMLRPVDALTLRVAYGFTDARFTRYDNGIQDLKGNHLPYAPQNTLFASASYTLPSLGNVQPVISVNTRGAGHIWWVDENTARQPFYATLGARIDMNISDWGSVALWGENLTNTKYDTFRFVSVGNAFVQRANPWSVGATLRYTLSL